MEDELYLENLEEYIKDENRIVTYKWLSRTLSVSVTTAKKMLQTYIERFSSKDSPLSVLYTITGESHESDKRILVHLVSEEEKEECCQTMFNKVWSVQVYSVQKSKPKVTSILYNSDYECMMEHLTSYSHWNTIDCPAVTTRLLPPTTSSHQAAESSKSTNTRHLSPPLVQKQEKESLTKGSVDSFFGNSLHPLPAAKIDNKKNGGGKENLTTKTKKSTMEKKDFFSSAKTTAKKSTTTTTAATTKSKPSVKEKASLVIKKEVQQQEEMTTISTPLPTNSIEEKATKPVTISTAASKSKVNNSKKKRKRIQNMSSSDESDSEMTTRPHQTLPQAKVTSPIKKEPAAGDKTKKRRKKVKRLVSKMFAEEDGSMVTEKHWEEVSTDATSEEESSNKKLTTNSSPSRPSVKKPSAAAAVKPPGSSQSSLKSFFSNK